MIRAAAILAAMTALAMPAGAIDERFPPYDCTEEYRAFLNSKPDFFLDAKITDLPAGVELEFHVWHEIRGALETAQWKRGRFPATISAGSTFDLGTIKLKPESFAKPPDR